MCLSELNLHSNYNISYRPCSVMRERGQGYEDVLRQSYLYTPCSPWLSAGRVWAVVESGPDWKLSPPAALCAIRERKKKVLDVSSCF